jgi:hypothetical protein
MKMAANGTEEAISCIIITRNGYIPCRLFYEQLIEARNMIQQCPAGNVMEFDITIGGKQVTALDILMAYSPGPRPKERG